jgi:hypothetical protein
MVTDFAPRFERWAGRIRARLAVRHALLGLTAGLALSALACGAAWWLGAGMPRSGLIVLVAFGAAGGLGLARRRRWSDADVALFLDARLQTREVVSTAVALGSEPAGDAGHDVVRQAMRALERPVTAGALPRLWTRWLLVAPPAAIAFAAAALAPTRAGPAVPVEPGTDAVVRADVPGLEAIEKLARLDVADPKAAADLDRATAEARALRAALRTGVERREALSRLAAIRDDLQSARLRGAEHAAHGLAEAASALRAAVALREATEALEAGDLVAFDRHMHELANRAEAASRSAALEGLEAARQAAARIGSPELAERLRRDAEHFAARARDAELLRELAEALADALSPRAREALERFRETGDLEAQRALAEALGEALRSLTEAERRRLAEQLSRQAEQARPGRALTPDELRQLAERLASPEGRQRLAETLRRLASASADPDGLRQDALDEAERGLAEAERDLAGVPLPAPGQPGSGSGSPGPDPSPGDHAGETAPVAGNTLRAKARTALDPSASTLAAGLGRTAPPPTSGFPAPTPRDLEAQGPSELEAVERGDLPEAYREQVRRYFTP